MNKFAKVSLVVLICVLLAACSGKETQPIANTSIPVPSTTPFPTFPPYPTKQILVNYWFGGEHDSFDAVLGAKFSKIALYSDGQIIFRGDPYRQKKLSSDEINALLSELENLGFYSIETNQQHDPTDQLYDFGDQYEKVYDGTYICVNVNSGRERELCTYEHYKEFLKPPMKKILEFMDNFKPTNLSVYHPDRLVLEILPHGAAPENENSKLLAWPANFPVLPDHWEIMYVEGEIAAEVFNFFGNTQNDRRVTLNGKEYTVYARPLLPHETPAWY